MSIKNGWLDEAGKTYIHYSVADIMADTGCGKNKILKCLKELEEDVSDWAYEAMCWAIQNGVMSGQKAGEVIYLKPKDNASRAVCATMIVQFEEKFSR